MLEYREYKIHPSLLPYVKLIWSLEGPAGQSVPPMRILPDLCFELVLHFRDPFITTQANGASGVQPFAFLVGTMKEWMEIEPNGSTGFIAVRFSTLGAHHFFGLPMNEVANQTVELSSLPGMEASGTVMDAMHMDCITPCKVEHLQHWLLQQFQWKGSDERMVACISLIHRSLGTISVRDLAAQLGLSSRQLLRGFQDDIGLSPKEFSRIVRFHHAIRLLRGADPGSLTDLTYDCGYYDQSHFIHEFQEYCGFSPTGFLQTNRDVVF